MKLVFIHGWASGPFIWREMIDHFSEHECHTVNLGFFGQENTTLPDGNFVAICHSLGGLWALKHCPERLSGLISIASFPCFYENVPRRILTQMKQNAAKDMRAQLIDFWRHAGMEPESGFTNLNTAQLINGLTWLSKWKANMPDNIPTKILAAQNDQIVTNSMTTDVWKNHDINWIEDGGHMLPLTQAEWCTNQIKEFLKNEF